VELDSAVRGALLPPAIRKGSLGAIPFSNMTKKIIRLQTVIPLLPHVLDPATPTG
jgi:hypothetical protein